MKEIIKRLLKDGNFVQSVATEMGQELARRKMNDSWSQDWNSEFYKTLQETVNKEVLKEVNTYMEQYNVKGLIETSVRAYLVKTISDVLKESK